MKILPKQNQAFLYLNYACNMKCEACYFEKTGYQKTFEEIKKEIEMLEDYRQLDCILLGGGEPTLHPELIRIIEYITSLGKETILVTNGTKTDDFNKYKEAGLNHIVLHIDEKQSISVDREEVATKVVEANMLCSLTIIIYQDTIQNLNDTIDYVLDSDLFHGLIANCATYSFGGDESKSVKLTEVRKILDKRGLEPDFYIPSVSGEVRWLLYNGDKVLHFEQFASSKEDHCVDCPDITVYKGKIIPSCCAIQ